jgi:hypothetical protein
MIEHPVGIRYNELSPAHQQQLLQLMNLYINRYTKSLAAVMLIDIQAAGLENLWFTWARLYRTCVGEALLLPHTGPYHHYRIR